MALAAPRKIVGRAIAHGGLRSRVVIATQVGPERKDGKVFRNGSRDRILREATGSLRRLRTDYIDIYQVHWTDPLVPSNRREVMSAKKILFSRRRFSPETTRSWFRFRPLRRSGITSLPCAWAKRRAAGGQYVDAPPDGAIRDGNLVTGFAWPAHPQFLALFLEVLGTRVSL
jgi:hypothetical protein